MKLGDRIYSVRDLLDMTQRELADKIGISYSVMNRIESGERPARDDEIKAIAKALSVSTDYLLGLTDLRNDNIETIAAHKEGEEYTEEELEEIENFKNYVRSRRKKGD